METGDAGPGNKRHCTSLASLAFGVFEEVESKLSFVLEKTRVGIQNRGVGRTFPMMENEQHGVFFFFTKAKQ